jgi:hypothetical protein
MYLRAIANMLKSRRFWIWDIAGIIIYAIPALIRFATGNVYVPILNLFMTPWVGHWIPSNLVEKILVNAFFPGGAGAIAGEIYFLNIKGRILRRRQKYLARLCGALLQTSAWSLFQLWGNTLNINGTWGGNIFEYPMVFPLNFLLASLSIFTPDVFGFLKSKLSRVSGLLKDRF